MIASVIVCTRDRSGQLDNLLAALAQQTMPADQFEILVVDDQSADDTPAVCRRWQQRLPQLQSIRLERHGGLAAAGNQAIAAARGRCLLFTDDDCLPHPEWIERLTAALDEAPVAAGAIESPPRRYIQLCHNIAQFHPFFVPGPVRRRPEFIAGANLGVRRDAMAQVGGFNPLSAVPDMEWILRARQLGLAIAFAAAAVIRHDPPRHSLRSILAYAAAHAEQTVRLRLQYRDLLATPRLLHSALLLRLAAPAIALITTAAIYRRNRALWRRAHTFPVVFLTKWAWCLGAARGVRRGRN